MSKDFLGSSALSDLGAGTDVLTYRGYAVEELVESATFEEVAFLLTRGRLPNRAELTEYLARLHQLRPLTVEIEHLLESIPSIDPMGAMDALRTAVSLLSVLEPERKFRDGCFGATDRLIAWLPGLMIYWQRFHAEGIRRRNESAEPTTAGHILALLTDQQPSDLQRCAVDASMILYADLAVNASTLAGRVCASTLADYHSCITAAIATLRGPLHGGASVAVMEFLDRFPDERSARERVRAMIQARERVPGFGHAIFRRDPRARILKKWACKLADGSPLFPVAEAIEDVMRAEKGLAPNVDFYTSCCYRFLNVPLSLFSPLFVCARVAGWSAHIAEQRAVKNLIHPAVTYTGPAPRPVPPLEER